MMILMHQQQLQLKLNQVMMKMKLKETDFDLFYKNSKVLESDMITYQTLGINDRDKLEIVKKNTNKHEIK